MASGHYHANRVPDIKGLKEWKEQYPERIMHSKAYRRPQELAGKVRNHFQKQLRVLTFARPCF